MLHSVTIKDYMSASLVTFSPDMHVLRAIHLLLENGVTGGPVTDNLGNMVGFLSEKDCMAVAIEAGYHEDWGGGTVADYMSTDVQTMEADESILIAAEKFINSPIKTLPVMSDNRLVGVVTRSDVLRAVESLR